MAKQPRASKKKTTHRTAPPILSAMEVRFCRLWVELGNATEAAERAGFVSTDRVSMGQRGYALLKKPQIRAAIRRMQQEAADAEQVTVNRLAQTFDRAAHADRTQIFDGKGRVKPPNKWPVELRSIITGFDVEEETETLTHPMTGVQTSTTTVKYKVRFRAGTEEGKILAKWRGMIESDLPGAGEDKAGGPRVQVIVEGTPDG